MSPDVGREAVYAAELAAFDGTSYEAVVPLDQLIESAAMIVRADWWPHGEIRVVSARSDAASSSTRQRVGGPPVVRLSAQQMTPATLLHEFAHVLAGVSLGHHRVFRRAHVDLVGFVFGDTEAHWLIDAYAAIGLDLGQRAWPQPPLRTIGGPVAL